MELTSVFMVLLFSYEKAYILAHRSPEIRLQDELVGTSVMKILEVRYSLQAANWLVCMGCD
jgi:hypothetical protein